MDHTDTRALRVRAFVPLHSQGKRANLLSARQFALVLRVSTRLAAVRLIEQRRRPRPAWDDTMLQVKPQLSPTHQCNVGCPRHRIRNPMRALTEWMTSQHSTATEGGLQAARFSTCPASPAAASARYRRVLANAKDSCRGYS
eukprot:scaffold215972_cov36-Tisochrysis_lutea.AAC.2